LKSIGIVLYILGGLSLFACKEKDGRLAVDKECRTVVERYGIYLGIAVSLVPILSFYAFMSRFISGITMGGIQRIKD
jgi:hypothetical protein